LNSPSDVDDLTNTEVKITSGGSQTARAGNTLVSKTSFLEALKVEMRNWISKILPQFADVLLGPDSFGSVLKSGVILCELVIHFIPGCIDQKLIHTGSLIFKQRDNISAFLEVCELTLQFDQNLNFVTADLFEEKALGKVATTIFEVQKRFCPEDAKISNQVATQKGMEQADAEIVPVANVDEEEAERERKAEIFRKERDAALEKARHEREEYEASERQRRKENSERQKREKEERLRLQREEEERQRQAEIEAERLRIEKIEREQREKEEAERRRIEEEQRRIEEEQRRIEEEERRIEEEERRIEAERRRAEESKRRAEEELKRRAEEEKRRVEEEKRVEEENRRVEEEKRKQMEEQKSRDEISTRKPSASTSKTLPTLPPKLNRENTGNPPSIKQQPVVTINNGRTATDRGGQSPTSQQQSEDGLHLVDDLRAQLAKLDEEEKMEREARETRKQLDDEIQPSASKIINNTADDGQVIKQPSIPIIKPLPKVINSTHEKVLKEIDEIKTFEQNKLSLFPVTFLGNTNVTSMIMTTTETVFEIVEKACAAKGWNVDDHEPYDHNGEQIQDIHLTPVQLKIQGILLKNKKGLEHTATLTIEITEESLRQFAKENSRSPRKPKGKTLFFSPRKDKDKDKK